jgi:hypothetical protein
MIEEQALCRVHRVGQQRNVTTIRYLMRDSFEEVRLYFTLEIMTLTRRADFPQASRRDPEAEEKAC